MVDKPRSQIRPGMNLKTNGVFPTRNALETEVYRMYRAGTSVRSIAKATGISRETVRRIVKPIRKIKLPPPVMADSVLVKEFFRIADAMSKKQNWVAHFTGIDRTALRRWRKGYDPRLSHFLRALQAFGLTLYISETHQHGERMAEARALIKKLEDEDVVSYPTFTR